MSWFRRNMRFGSWCALFALAIQLGLSFGHLHFASSAAAAALASAAAEPAGAADDPPAPTKHSRVADYCTICASIHLMTGLLTAEPPSVSRLQPSNGERLKVLIEATTSSYSGIPFNARAPPLA
jgi:hypothetical protein